MIRNKTDWETISRHYRAGCRSLRDIGNEYGISEGAIRKRAKKEGWPRDLSEQIKAKATEKVRIEAVRGGTQGASERSIIEAESDIQSRVALSHRKDIPQKRELVAKLFAEIEAMTDNKELSETLQEALANDDAKVLAQAVNKVVSLPQRIKGTADLVNAYKTLIMLEREAFGINDDAGSSEDALANLIKKVQARRVDLVQAARASSYDTY